MKGKLLQAPLSPPLAGRSWGQAGHHLQWTAISAGWALALPVQVGKYRLRGSPIRESPKQTSRDRGMSARATSPLGKPRHSELQIVGGSFCCLTHLCVWLSTSLMLLKALALQ